MDTEGGWEVPSPENWGCCCVPAGILALQASACTHTHPSWPISCELRQFLMKNFFNFVAGIIYKVVHKGRLY